MQMHETWIGRHAEPQGLIAGRCLTRFSVSVTMSGSILSSGRRRCERFLRFSPRRRFRRHGKGARASPNSDAIRVLIGDGERREYPRQSGMTKAVPADTLGIERTRTRTRENWTQTQQTRIVLRGHDTHSAARTCTQTAIIPTKRAIEVSAAASSTTARNMISSMNE